MIQKAISFIRNSKFLLITAGAGIGAQSGLPTFRGDHGFWKNYPPFANKFRFVECANPQFLSQEPKRFWGFYGHRLELYRKTKPHQGFHILRQLALCKQDYFVVTSNVDGHFQKSGFPQEKVYQIHGTIHHCQCTSCCELLPSPPQIGYSLQSFQAIAIPKCKCGGTLRPNILMFNDYEYIDRLQTKKQQQFDALLQKYRREQICVIEIGAGKSVATIRNISQRVTNNLIRINIQQQDSGQCVYLREGVLNSLLMIKQRIRENV